MTNVLPLTRSWFLLLKNQLSFVPHFNPQIFILHLTFIFSPSDINSSQHCNETLKFHALYSTALRPPSSLKFNLCPSSWQFLLLDLPLLLNIPEPRYLIWNVSPHILLHDNSLAKNLRSSTCPEFSWVSHYRILDSAPQILSHGILSIVFDFLTYLHDTWPDANKSLAFFFSFLFQNPNTNQLWHFQWFL